MEYWFGELHLPGKRVQITKEDYELLLEKKRTVVVALRLESLFFVFCESVKDLERLILNEAFDDHFGGRFQTASLLDINLKFDALRDKLNVKMLSVLSAARAYHDQRKKLLSKLGSPVGIGENADAMFSKFYDFSLNYRIMEALRNFAQHRELPIGSVTLSGSTRHSSYAAFDEPTVFRAAISPHILVEGLIDDKDFKRAVAKELGGLDKTKLDARALVRSYLSMISYGHGKVRELLEPALLDAEGTIESFADRFSAQSGGSLPGHATAWVVDGNRVIEDEYLDKVLFDRIRSRQEGLVKWQSIRSSFVSTELIEEKGVYIGEFDDVWRD